MKVEGPDAAGYRVVRLDSFEDVNKGDLVSADDISGIVVYKDTPDSQKTVTLTCGIKILPKGMR